MNRRRFMRIFSLSSVAVLLSACTSRRVLVGKPGPQGPPPHAPAHGYRRKNRHGLEMTYDANLGVYIVPARPMHYYLDGVYYRKNNKKWEKSTNLNKKWKEIHTNDLPRGLQNN